MSSTTVVCGLHAHTRSERCALRSGNVHSADGWRDVLEPVVARYRKANAVRLQLHALAYNLANFLRTLALPEQVKQWSMTTLRDRLVKIGAKVVRHGRSVIFQMAEVAVRRDLFERILGAIAALRPLPPARC